MTEHARIDGPRVCMLSYYFEPDYSGSAIQARNLCRGLVASGVRPFVVSAMIGSRVAEDRVDGLRVFRLPAPGSGSNRVASFWAALARFLVVRRRDYDIVHAHGTLQHVPAGPIGRWLGKPTILKIAMAQSDINFPRQGRLWGRVNRWGVGRFSRYVATSGDIERELAERGLDTSRVLRIPNGVDTDVFRPVEGEAERDRLKRDLGLPAGPLVAFVGMLIPRKNVHVLLEAFLRARRAHPDAHLVVVGPAPPLGSTSRYPERLHDIVRGAGAEDGVTFVGRVPSSAPYLRAADVFAFPSAQEGMPNVLLEAMACGIPSIASRIGGNSDLVRDGEEGHLFEPTDVDALARLLEELFANSVRRLTVGGAARRRVLGSYSLDAVTGRYVALYGELLRSASS